MHFTWCYIAFLTSFNSGFENRFFNFQKFIIQIKDYNQLACFLGGRYPGGKIFRSSSIAWAVLNWSWSLIIVGAWICTAACRSAISLYSVSPVFFLTSCVSLTISSFSSCPCHSPKELFLVGLNFRSTDWEMPWRKSIYNKRRTIITHCFWAYIVTLMSLARVTAINLNYMLVN